MLSMKWLAAHILLLLASPQSSCEAKQERHHTCRNIPGSPGYPSAATWDRLNATIFGRLAVAVPSAKYCASLPGGACTDEQWASAQFRNTIPGAMNQVNWEQGYDLTPPSLCLRNASTCDQGDVPLYSVEALTAADVQSAVKFARAHNLRLAIKASGHDYLGRSTAPHSLLIRTSGLQNITFADRFMVGKQNLGSAVTVGSGVHLSDIYQAAKANGKIVVGGSAATVCAGGGYLQGGGHSALGPTLGMASDNALEFQVVVASGELLTVNSISHPDLFYALRGGGAGSWGVIVSATVRTFPIFNATLSVILLASTDTTALSTLAGVHAKHIFDIDPVRGGQYFFLTQTSPGGAGGFAILTYMPNTTVEHGTALLAPFLSAAKAIAGIAVVQETYVDGIVNDLLFQADDSVGENVVLGSRLIPEATYRDSPESVGRVYQELLDGGALNILGHLVAGGQVSANERISSALNPAWRTAKVHLVLVNGWTDSATLEKISAERTVFKNTHLPILEKLSGSNAGSYSNEADVLETNFQTTFFGPNYAKLSAIKKKYDPNDLFIVGAGVGSERWDQWGLCTV
ncbi:FAD-binding domain-containing protein [Mycena rebaudengoi]|nr:FAD-binding domain-containing protein [Mycena rebaudengoi]